MKAFIGQIRFMIKDAWKSRGRRSHIDWDSATAIRHSARPSAAARGAGGSSPTGASYEIAAEANTRYLESFEKTR